MDGGLLTWVGFTGSVACLVSHTFARREGPIAVAVLMFLGGGDMKAAIALGDGCDFG